MLSGYRVFTRRFVKSFPVLSGGFEIETELTVHALELEMPVGEMKNAVLFPAAGLRLQAQHLARTVPASSRPCCGSIAPSARCRCSPAWGLSLGIVAVGLAIPIFVTYVQDGVVPRLPTAVLSTGLMVLAFLSIVCGVILDTVTRGQA